MRVISIWYLAGILLVMLLIAACGDTISPQEEQATISALYATQTILAQDFVATITAVVHDQDDQRTATRAARFTAAAIYDATQTPLAALTITADAHATQTADAHARIATQQVLNDQRTATANASATIAAQPTATPRPTLTPTPPHGLIVTVTSTPEPGLNSLQIPTPISSPAPSVITRQGIGGLLPARDLVRRRVP